MLRCGLLGETLGHSYSPMIHHELGEYDYRLFEVSKEDLDAFLCSDRWDGLNVTIPYKKAVVSYCAELSEAAAKLQSVNTLVHRPDGTLYGDNTDLFGFLYMVRRSGIDPAGKKALGVSCRSELDLISKLSESQDALYDRIQQLIRELTGIPADAKTAAEYCRQVIIPSMDAIRSHADRLEELTAKKYWPFPTYGDLLFGVR